MNSSHSVVITGGTGFVGYWMQRTKPKEMRTQFLDQYAYDLSLDPKEMGSWDYIVHLAPVSPSRVLKYAHRHHSRVLFASSGAVYEGTNDYAYHKRLWESQCTHSGVDVVIARLFTFVGAHLKNLYAITQFIEAAKAGKPLEVWGDGSTVRSYLYGEDLGRWMWKILLEGDGVYDVGSINPYTILQVARLVADVIPAKIHVLNNGHPETFYIPDTTRVEKLGCIETVGLKEAIERTIHEGE
jgi:nucleoside-diphosphate-sugar epimerase